MKYRREIDGLRAIAVVPVILGHAGVSFLKGGYLGVDVFFVISGYLITTLIYKDLEKKRFSILNFYERRARRLLPALFAVLIPTTLLGYFVLLPEDLENLGQSLVATLAFANNVLLYLTSGYWAMEAEFKPLMHTWSLAVEEQYYLVAPVMLYVFYRMGKKALFLSFLLILGTSLAFSQYASVHLPTFNFLMIFTRAWELAIGALAALVMISPRFDRYRDHAASGAMAAVGLVLICVSMVLFAPETPHPSLLTLFPTLGTVFIVLFAGPNNLTGKLLSTKAFVGIGLISYSAYLWHHALFAYARVLSLEPPGLDLMLGLSALTLVLSYLSWRFVEQPFRRRETVPNLYFIPAAGVGCALFAAVGLWWHASSGLLKHSEELYYGGEIRPSMNRIYTDSVYKLRRDSFEGMPNDVNVLVVGNSFARDFINMGLENGYFSQHNVIYLDRPVPEPSEMSPGQPNHSLYAQSDYVIFASGYNGREAAQIMECAAILREHTTAKIIVVGTKNFGWNNNAVMLLPEDKRYTYRAKVLQDILQANREARKVVPESMYVDLLDLLNTQDGRIKVFTPDRKFISQDRRHLTRNGALYVGQKAFEHQLLQPLK
ncbi:MAG: acyltransferase family protein [Opitutales bacterium]